MIKNFKVLSNGVNMPSIGFGTYKSGSDEETAKIVKYALEAGYRQIDTASFYGNEVGIGNGIKESGIKREDLFLVTKLWNDDHGYDKTIEAFNKSLERLQVDYLDLYLIHRFDYETPMEETMEALNELVTSGKVRAIGASAMYGYQFHNLQLVAEKNNWAKFQSMQNHYNFTLPRR